MSYQIYSNSVPTLGNLTYSGAGIYQVTGSTGYTLNTSATNGTWASTNSSAIQVKGDAIFEGKVTIDGQDLAETLESIKSRLAILVPNPKLLDKYEALKQAYDHYKTLEALCVEQNNSDQ
jgi:hypothetical protein